MLGRVVRRFLPTLQGLACSNEALKSKSKRHRPLTTNPCTTSDERCKKTVCGRKAQRLACRNRSLNPKPLSPESWSTEKTAKEQPFCHGRQQV